MIKIILLSLLGLCFGSFFNVVVSRDDWYKNRSRCDGCGKVLKWYDLVPVISYLMLGGKCRYCKSKISLTHLLSETLLGIGFGVIALLNLSLLDSIIAWVTIISLGFNSVMDINKYQMEAISNYAAMLIIGILRIVQLWNTSLLWISLGIFILLYLAFIVCYIAFEKKIGFGDFEALMMIFLSCGYLGGIYVVFYTGIISLVFILPMLVLKKITLKDALPLLPFMYLGYLANLII